MLWAQAPLRPHLLVGPQGPHGSQGADPLGRRECMWWQNPAIVSITEGIVQRNPQSKI